MGHSVGAIESSLFTHGLIRVNLRLGQLGFRGPAEFAHTLKRHVILNRYL